MKFGKPRMAVLSDAQRELIYDFTLTHPGPYMVVIIYATTKNCTKSTIEIDARTTSVSYNGTAAINNCRYSTLCRAVAVNRDNKLAVFDFDIIHAKITLKVCATNFQEIWKVSILLKVFFACISREQVMESASNQWLLFLVKNGHWITFNQNHHVLKKTTIASHLFIRRLQNLKE